MWDEMDVPTELQSWMSKNSPFDDDVNTFPETFCAPLGLGETLGRKCKIIQDSCSSIDCVDMEVWKEPGSAWEYLVVMSITNLNMVSLSGVLAGRRIYLTTHGTRL